MEDDLVTTQIVDIPSKSKSYLQKYFDLLECDSTADSETIKRAFHRLALQCHPDKLTSAEEEEKKIGAAKFNEIKKAYDILCKADVIAFDDGLSDLFGNMSNMFSKMRENMEKMNDALERILKQTQAIEETLDKILKDTSQLREKHFEKLGSPIKIIKVGDDSLPEDIVEIHVRTFTPDNRDIFRKMLVWMHEHHPDIEMRSDYDDIWDETGEYYYFQTEATQYDQICNNLLDHLCTK